MSYDIELIDPVTKKIIELPTPHFMRGGTYAVSGTTLAELNITWNYSQYFCKVFGDDGIRSIYGLTGEESLPILESAARKLKDDVDDNYWKATEGNAKRALSHLIILAVLAPNGIWNGD